MALMTWGEFKKLVEDADVQDDYEITYMDFSYPDNDYSDRTIEVFVDHEKKDFAVH